MKINLYRVIPSIYPAQFLIKNNKGEITGPIFLLSFILSAWFIIFCWKTTLNYRDLHDRLDQLLCVKEYNGELNYFTKNIERSNLAIKFSSYARMISIWFPGLSVVNEDVKFTLKQYQNLQLFSHLQKITSLRNSNCSIPMNVTKTPYQHLGFKFVRDEFETVIKRSSEWDYYFTRKKQLIKIHYRFSSHPAKPLFITSFLMNKENFLPSNLPSF